ncbi:MAG: hypothetical protein HFF73_01970 [Oscillospiraceae bacterium]|uniref:hypothetical protein n=1 Tax=Acutalibacter muris TaxID=1796620 RepID=UPI002171B37D|nr:hypothetical protein [Acutalibacter muris]MCI8438271.1 hypothetical protein [Oscillospiraceae bacterium]
MKKKLLLGAVLALLLSATAFASGGSYRTTVDALCNLPEISVTVPSSAEVFINPYRIPITIESDESTAQIVSTPACIENKSAVPISITATVTGTIKEGSDMGLYSYSTQGQELTSKRAFVYLEMQAATSTSPADANWDSEYDVEKHVAIRAGVARTKKDMVTIAQADQPKHFGAFRLAGDCVPTPRKPWTAADGIDVEIAFTFKALPVWTEIP